MQSSSHPLKMNFPFFGRHNDRHTTFGRAIFIIGFSYLVFQIMMSLPEHVANIDSKSFIKATSFIIDVCAE